MKPSAPVMTTRIRSFLRRRRFAAGNALHEIELQQQILHAVDIEPTRIVRVVVLAGRVMRGSPCSTNLA